MRRKDVVYTKESLPLGPLSEYYALPPTHPSHLVRALSEMRENNETFAFAPLKLPVG